MYQDRRPRFAPVQEGDELDVKIESVGEKGDGVARKQGFVLFVPKTKAGDEVRIRVTRVLKNVGFAEVIGQSQTSHAHAKKPEPAPEETFSEENDSENFGDEPEAEEVAERSDDDYDENSDDK